MKIYARIGAIIVSLLIIAGGVFFYFNNNKTEEKKFEMYKPEEIPSTNNKEIKTDNPDNTESKQEKNIKKTSINFDSDNDKYAKKYTTYQTKYDKKAMDTIKLLENIYVYKKNINNNLTNQELLQMGLDLFLTNNYINKIDNANMLGFTSDIFSGKRKILLDELNGYIYAYFNKIATVENIKSPFFTELNFDTLFYYDKEYGWFKYNSEFVGSGERDLKVYSRYLSSTYNESDKTLTINVANVYSASAFYDDEYYYSVDTIDKKDNLLIKLDFDPSSDDYSILQPYDKLYKLPLEKLQKATYVFDVSEDSYSLISLTIN